MWFFFSFLLWTILFTEKAPSEAIVRELCECQSPKQVLGPAELSYQAAILHSGHLHRLMTANWAGMSIWYPDIYLRFSLCDVTQKDPFCKLCDIPVKRLINCWESVASPKSMEWFYSRAVLSEQLWYKVIIISTIMISSIKQPYDSRQTKLWSRTIGEISFFLGKFYSKMNLIKNSK